VSVPPNGNTVRILRHHDDPGGVLLRLPNLAQIQSAAELVHEAIPPTPQIRWPLLCERIGADVWVTHENHTALGAFKVRGGVVYLAELLAKHPAVDGVIAATRGNHGQSIALAAAQRGLRTVVVVPHGNSREKNAAMRAQGAEVIEEGEDFQDAFEHAAKLSEEQHLHFVRSFHDALVRGVASYALELCHAVPNLDAIYVPIGLGSGICGTIAVRNALALRTEIIGVVAQGAPAYALSASAGKVIASERAETIADGMAVRVPDLEAFETISANISRLVTVSDAEIRAAMRNLFTDTHNVAEGAGAAALAGLSKESDRMKGKRVAVVLSGGNIDKDLFAEVLVEAP
jgi:threonine dehydratase